jgi:hypothetical protein
MDGQKLLRAFLGSGGAAMLVACLVAPQVERAVAHTSPGTNMMFAYVDRSRPHSAKRAATAFMSIVWTLPPECGHTSSTSAISQTRRSLLLARTSDFFIQFTVMVTMPPPSC